jgi:transcriptional regulator with XRE-family HTH domain
MAVYRQLTLCRRIKGLRESSGYSQAFVADKMGISQAAYSRFESGEVEMAVSKVISIADLYSVPLDILLAGV